MIYSYQVCYREHSSKRLKHYLVTNTYESAKWHVDDYNAHPPNGIQATWFVVPVTSKTKHKWLWRRCPF